MRPPLWHTVGFCKRELEGVCLVLSRGGADTPHSATYHGNDKEVAQPPAHSFTRSLETATLLRPLLRPVSVSCARLRFFAYLFFNGCGRLPVFLCSIVPAGARARTHVDRQRVVSAVNLSRAPRAAHLAPPRPEHCTAPTRAPPRHPFPRYRVSLAAP